MSDLPDPRFGTHTHAILGACIEVHRHLGPGLLESAYERCLAHEMSERGLRFVRQPRVPLVYKNLRVERAYQPDFIVENQVLVEVKTVQALLAIHEAQVRTYLRLTGLPIGLLVNFNVQVLRDGGIRRLAISPSAHPPGG